MIINNNIITRENQGFIEISKMTQNKKLYTSSAFIILTSVLGLS